MKICYLPSCKLYILFVISMICKDFVKEFNVNEKSGLTNILMPCLTKLGQNIFSDDQEPFIKLLESLTENALYKALLNAHYAMDL